MVQAEYIAEPLRKKNCLWEEFQKEMEGIYTTTADSTTLDESPMAYKSMERNCKTYRTNHRNYQTNSPCLQFQSR